MKHLLLFCVTVFFAVVCYARFQKKIERSWVKTEIENLSGKELEPDTLYTRYTFEKSKLYIGFSPGWDNAIQPWSISGNDLTIGFDTYKIEELTDTSLTFALKGFRRFKFLSEEYLATQEKNLVHLGEFNGKPLYKANNFITPRYTKGASLRDVLQKNVEGYNIRKATYFLASFIVNEKGRIENVQILQGITEGFDNEITRQLMKTSKKWKPALFKGSPIQTQMFYDIKYLDSITPFSSGSLE